MKTPFLTVPVLYDGKEYCDMSEEERQLIGEEERERQEKTVETAINVHHIISYNPNKARGIVTIRLVDGCAIGVDMEYSLFEAMLSGMYDNE